MRKESFFGTLKTFLRFPNFAAMPLAAKQVKSGRKNKATVVLFWIILLMLLPITLIVEIAFFVWALVLSLQEIKREKKAARAAKKKEAILLEKKRCEEEAQKNREKQRQDMVLSLIAAEKTEELKELFRNNKLKDAEVAGWLKKDPQIKAFLISTCAQLGQHTLSQMVAQDTEEFIIRQLKAYHPGSKKWVSLLQNSCAAGTKKLTAFLLSDGQLNADSWEWLVSWYVADPQAAKSSLLLIEVSEKFKYSKNTVGMDYSTFVLKKVADHEVSQYLQL